MVAECNRPRPKAARCGPVPTIRWVVRPAAIVVASQVVSVMEGKLCEGTILDSARIVKGEVGDLKGKMIVKVMNEEVERSETS